MLRTHALLDLLSKENLLAQVIRGLGVDLITKTHAQVAGVPPSLPAIGPAHPRKIDTMGLLVAKREPGPGRGTQGQGLASKSSTPGIHHSPVVAAKSIGQAFQPPPLPCVSRACGLE